MSGVKDRPQFKQTTVEKKEKQDTLSKLQTIRAYRSLIWKYKNESARLSIVQQANSHKQEQYSFWLFARSIVYVKEYFPVYM